MARVASSATSVELAANADRTGLTIYNDSTAVLKINRNAAASATAFVVAIPAGGYWESPAYLNTPDGQWTGIWASVNGAANVTEF